MGVFGDIETAVDVTVEIRPVDIGRRRRDRAIDDGWKAAAIAGERSPEIGDQRVALPIGDGEKFRRDHPERQSLGFGGKAAGIGVVAAAEFDRGLDQKAAGIIADRAERIVVDLEALARRLADDGARHRRRQRRLVGGFRTAESTTAAAQIWIRRRRRAAGTWRRLRLGLARIEFRLLALAVERVEAGVRCAAGGGKAIGGNLADPRRRAGVLAAKPVVIGWVDGAVGGIDAGVVAGLAQRRILRRDEAAGHRAQQIGSQRLGLRRTVIATAISARHANSARKVVARLRRPLAGPVITIEILQQIHTLADRVPCAREPASRKTSLTELKQLWLMTR